MVLNAAYALATACVKEYQSKFSRKDFTGPQLFACLVLREHQKKSYRGVVALLKRTTMSPSASTRSGRPSPSISAMATPMGPKTPR